MRRFAKPFWGLKPPTGVRIPPSPPRLKSSVNMRPFAICYYFCRWLLYLYLSLLEFKFKTGWNFSWRIRLTRVFGSPSCCRSHSLYLNKVGSPEWNPYAERLPQATTVLETVVLRLTCWSHARDWLPQTH